MPQFETLFLISQIFWLVISFGLLYLGVRWIIFPMYNRIFEERLRIIDEPLKKAEELVVETENLKEKAVQRKEQFAGYCNQQLNQAYQEGKQYFDLKTQKMEKQLLNAFKKRVQKTEKEEKKLSNNADFVMKALKGER